MKRCRTCGEEKSLEEYHISRRERDGHDTQCRICANAENREKGATDRGREAAMLRNRRYRERRAAELKERRTTPEYYERHQRVCRDYRERLKAEREADREFVASVFDRSQKGQRYALTIEVNRRRLAVMDRTGVDAVREGLLRFEFTRATCEATIRALEAERRDIVNRLLKLRMAAKQHNRQVGEMRRAA